MTTPPTAAQADALARLLEVTDSKDGAGVCVALSEVWHAGLHPEMCELLVRLTEAPWHSRHEDVVLAIQELQCASAVPALERTAHATHAYRSYDEFFGLARKCTWALADIGTPDAYQALQRLSQSTNSQIAAYALRRLTRWKDELARKPIGMIEIDVQA